jgi:spore maturation protein CgeB
VRFALFYHSVRSDWNHGNAHFLRGVVRALLALGHEVVCYEEAGNWSTANLVAEHGIRPLVQFHRRFPFVKVHLYHREPAVALERRLLRELQGIDVVVIHEWTAVENPQLLDILTRGKRFCGYSLLFHDTHYRILTQPTRLARLEPGRFDAILAYGPSIAAEYRHRFGLRNVHVVHEAADTPLFHPLMPDPGLPMDDAIFIGNWGGRDRAHELREFLLRPAKHVRGYGRFAVHGVRYPPSAVATIERFYGVDFRGWLPNYLVPQAYAQSRVAIHVVRRQYAHALYGIPTIRVFEALACGVPLVSTRWPDTDGLFRAGRDYLVVDTRSQMDEALAWLWGDDLAREQLIASGLARIKAQHTCFHRAEQLLGIVASLRRTPAVRPERVEAPLDTPLPAVRPDRVSPTVALLSSAPAANKHP